MAVIIIDGYNLIGVAHGDLAQERETLIARLAAYRKLKGHDVTVVFDGWKSGQGRETSATTGGVKVIYSRLGDTADAVIKRITAADRREWIVVSSDRAISDHAWAVGSVPVSADAFMHALQRAPAHPGGAFEALPDDEEEPDAAPKRGSGRTPSRKERALQRVLKKL